MTHYEPVVSEFVALSSSLGSPMKTTASTAALSRQAR